MTLAEEVARLRRTLRRLVSRHIALESSRPFNQLLALRVVAAGEVHTQAALAERLSVDAPAVSRLVARLTGDGLLTQKPGPDRRCVCLGVTREGKHQVAILERALGRLERQVRGLLDAAEYRRTVATLGKLQDGLSGAEAPHGRARHDAARRAPSAVAARHRRS